nr:DUF6351 family protein [Caldimonas sp.]
MILARNAAAALFASAIGIGLAACGGRSDDDDGPLAGTTVQTLSNRADLIAGGSALVEVRLPAGAQASRLKVDVDGVDVTPAFVTRPDGRTVGLVSGLKVGDNNLNVTSTDDSFAGARLVVTSHPRGGPVLLSSQITPYVCATPAPVAEAGNTPGSNASGLTTAATDAQCSIATEYKLFYRTLTPVTATQGDGGCSFVLPDPSPTASNPNPTTPANSCFQPYVQGGTPAASVASTTTTAGLTVPYIVRVERGTLNRGIYDVAVLFNPAVPWTATAPQAQWNGKVLYNFGASTGQPRRQFRSTQNWADNAALSRGFIVADNSLTDSSSNSNRALNAETLMMMKEHIAENYGEILFTMGNGCSGGSIQQNTAASIYPGLLDGLQVQCNYVDSITTGIEVTDCVLLVNFYASPEWAALTTGLSQAQINAKKAAINGHQDQLGCHSWNNAFGFNGRAGNYVPTLVTNAAGAIAPTGAPRNNCQLPAALVYDPVTNPGGTRCGDADASVAVWGLATGTTRANSTLDNIGVQYGYKALVAGAITAEEFVTLNERIGGFDVNGVPAATRSTADLPALDIAYRSGIVGSGRQLAKVAIIDLRGYDDQGIHHIWRSFSERDRLDAEGGGHANQVMWRFGTGLTPSAASGLTLQSFLTMDTWLSNLSTQAPKAFVNAERTQAQVVAGKPADAFDFCYLTSDTAFTTKVTDFSVCDTDPRLVPKSSPHQVAGGPRTENILKCQLKPINFGEYGNVTFTAAQQTRLNAVFPTGVCDWSRPGVGQQAAVSPLTFKAGPGGVPLPAAPSSTRI